MRKHIGTKIMSMLALLAVVFGINAIISAYSSSQAMEAMETITATYLQMQQNDTALDEYGDLNHHPVLFCIVPFSAFFLLFPAA